eukprot:GFUD01004162.1.p1 GENE.GFUD01004162.1~~GFUD01004162.1.p1  ORF type:complete len:290 (+),score=57.09 GFUD01004162.1:60-929(+)
MASQCHSTFLKNEISLLKRAQFFQDTVIVCRNGVLRQNSLLTFLLFQEVLSGVETLDEDFTIFLPEFEVAFVHKMMENLLSHAKDPPDSKSVISQFSLILPFDSSVKSKKCDKSRKRLQRKESECKVCGKILKRSRWEVKEHEQLHISGEGFVKCLVPSGSLGKCNKEFETKDQLQEHMTKVHKVKYLKCNLCDSRFASDSLRMAHVNSVHTNSCLSKQPIVGRNMNSNLTKFNEWKANDQSRKSLKHPGCGVAQFKCDVCNIYYLRKYKLEQHMKETHGEMMDCFVTN